MPPGARVTINPSRAPITMPVKTQVYLQTAKVAIRAATRVAPMAAIVRTETRDADPHKNHADHRIRDGNKETPITSATRATAISITATATTTATAETRTEIGHKQTVAENHKAKTATATTGTAQIRTASINTEAATGTGKIRHASQRDKLQ